MTKQLCPIRHVGGRGVESAEKNKCQHKEKHNKYSLLYAFGIIRNHQTETRHGQYKYGGKKIEGDETALGKEVVKQPCDKNTNT